MQTITYLYDTYEDAAATVRDLEAAGISREDISLMANNAEGRYAAPEAAANSAGSGAATGASIGTVIGGGAGLLAGLGLLAIPGVGPVVAAGWLVATLAGAAAGAGVGAASGGIIGAMTEAGVSPESAQVYAEGVRRGGTLVTARVEESQANDAERIMSQHYPVDPATRVAAYRNQGWTSFDPAAPAYTPEELARERARYRRDRAA